MSFRVFPWLVLKQAPFGYKCDNVFTIVIADAVRSYNDKGVPTPMPNT